MEKILIWKEKPSTYDLLWLISWELLLAIHSALENIGCTRYFALLIWTWVVLSEVKCRQQVAGSIPCYNCYVTRYFRTTSTRTSSDQCLALVVGLVLAWPTWNTVSRRPWFFLFRVGIPRSSKLFSGEKNYFIHILIMIATIRLQNPVSIESLEVWWQKSRKCSGAFQFWVAEIIFDMHFIRSSSKFANFFCVIKLSL